MTTDNANHDSSQTTAGERLRNAREAAGLTVAEVADKQHLRPAIIAAIESGDYRKIGSELFLKGYVRAYAAQVGLDQNSVVRQLDQELEPLREEKKAQVEANPLVTIERRKRHKQRIARIVIVLVILVAVFYAGSLYLAGQQEAASENDAGEEAEDQSEPVDAEEDDESAELDAEPEQAQDSTAAPASADGMDPALESPGQAGTDVPQDSQPAEAAPAETGAEDPVDQTESGTADEMIVSTPLSEREPRSQDEGEGRLEVGFSGDCWVEVQDANGRTLEASLQRQGDTLSISGEAPLRVIFGAVSGVSSVSFNGEPVAMSNRRTRNDRVVLNLPD